MNQIPISAVRIGEEEERLVLEVLRSGRLAQGPMVERLEREFAPLAGAAHAVAVANGTVALEAALGALGVGPGDEVLTSPFTFIATSNAVLRTGASVRFADIRLDDFCLDPAQLEARLTPRTRVLLPVHLYGQVADMDPLLELARRRGLLVLEDAAQAHLATYRGRPAGSFGDAATFSLYATKNLQSGEGGIVTTGRDEVADRLRLLRNQGMRARYEYEMVGDNHRLTDVQAAIAVPQLARLRELTERRRRNASFLSEGLAEVPGLVTPQAMPGREHVWHQYTVRVTEEAKLDRDAALSGLAERGVGAGVYYPRPLYDYAAYRELERVDHDPMPNAERACREVLSLPVHPYLSEDDLERIVAAVRDLLC